jgi:DMSO/TMAO reductase YedYZ molybdopterin-dependent catalytic subunit
VPTGADPGRPFGRTAREEGSSVTDDDGPPGGLLDRSRGAVARSRATVARVVARVRSRLPPETGVELLVAALAGVAGVAGSFALVGFTPPWVVVPVESTLATYVPGIAITVAITVLGDLGQKLSLLTAVGLAVAGVGLATLAGRAVARRLDNRAAGVALPAGLTFLSWAPLVGVYSASGAAAGAGGVALGATTLAVAGGFRAEPTLSAPRRRLLGASVAGVGVGLAGYLTGRRVAAGASTEPPTAADVQTAEDVRLDGVDAEGIAGLLGESRRASLDVAGLEPLVSTAFYEVSYSSVDPRPTVDDWTLSVTGAVGSERELDYRELRALPETSEFLTLRCVGEQQNGQKTDTALWTGVPMSAVLEGVEPEGEYVVMRAADGYYEEFPREALEGAMLAYGMNGASLPRGHGYPVRALIPGHWGEINVKWITEIEFSTEPVTGYWETKGWHGTGPVKTVAKLHHPGPDSGPTRTDDGRLEVGGHAYAGVRGVGAVEVSVDGGDSWQEATLSDPLPGEDVWRQWVHRYEDPGESHEVVVRAVEADGRVQPREETGPYPSGSSGWVSRRFDP